MDAMALQELSQAARDTKLLVAARDQAPLEELELLLKAGANADAGWPASGHTALQYATHRGDIAMAHLLLRYGASINLGDHENYTPLHRATYAGREAMVRFLLAHGADPNQRDRNSFLPLHIAAENGAEAIAYALLDAGSSTQLMAAHEQGRASVKDLLMHGQNARQPRLWQGVYDRIDHQEAAYAQPIPAGLSKAEWMAEPEEKGLAWLDQPRVWKDFAHVEQSLAAQGEHFGLEDLRKVNASQVSWFQRAVECRALKPLLEHLAAHGERLELEDMVTPQHHPTPLLEAMIRHFAVPVVCDPKYWDSAADLRQFLHVLPLETRQQFSGWHQLLATVGRLEQQGQGRG